MNQNDISIRYTVYTDYTVK